MLRTLAAFVLALPLCACAVRLQPKAEVGSSPPSVSIPDDRAAVIVLIDGLRWREVFYGADPALTASPTPLTPFLASFAQTGLLVGDRKAGQCAQVENAFWFSYPGYAETLEGAPNAAIRSNDKVPNPNPTILEWVNAQAGFHGKVAAFAEWQAVPFILNTARSNLPVFVPPDGPKNRDPAVIAEALRVYRGSNPPRLSFIELGDTDNRAHEGDYAAVMAAASRADAFLADLWASIEANPSLAGRTSLIVTTDHGRGPTEGGGWKNHGSGRFKWAPRVPGVRQEGSYETWIAARGPDIKGSATINGCAVNGQVAATALTALGLRSTDFRKDARPPLAIFRERR